MLKRRQQIRTQTPLLFADSLKVPTLQQQRKEPLGEIFRFLLLNALSPHETINRSPVSAAKFIERRLCCWACTLRRQHHTPVSSCKRDAPVLRARADPIPFRMILLTPKAT